jgi:hypothetical protein
VRQLKLKETLADMDVIISPQNPAVEVGFAKNGRGPLTVCITDIPDDVTDIEVLRKYRLTIFMNGENANYTYPYSDLDPGKINWK